MSTCRGGGWTRVGARPTLENNSIWGGGIYPLLGGPFFRLEGTFSPFVVIFSIWGGGGVSTYVEKFLGLFLYLQKFLRASML